MGNVPVLSVVDGHIEVYIGFLRNRVSLGVHDRYASYLRKMPLLTLSSFDAHFSGRVVFGVTGKTMNNELGVFKGYLRWLSSRGFPVDLSLLSYPRFRHVPRKFRRALTAEELARLRAISGSRWAWWSFLVHTGLRKSEFEGLTWSDVLDGSIRVIDAKNPLKQRMVPLHPEVVEILCGVGSRESVVGGGKQGGGLFRLPKGPSSLLRIFKKDLMRAGIPNEIDLHCLRVTFVSGLARAGVSPRTAQELAGHSDIQTTLKIYTKVTDRDKVEAVNRLVF